MPFNSDGFTGCWGSSAKKYLFWSTAGIVMVGTAVATAAAAAVGAVGVAVVATSIGRAAVAVADAGGGGGGGGATEVAFLTRPLFCRVRSSSSCSGIGTSSCL